MDIIALIIVCNLVSWIVMGTICYIVCTRVVRKELDELIDDLMTLNDFEKELSGKSMSSEYASLEELKRRATNLEKYPWCCDNCANTKHEPHDLDPYGVKAAKDVKSNK